MKTVKCRITQIARHNSAGFLIKRIKILVRFKYSASQRGRQIRYLIYVVMKNLRVSTNNALYLGDGTRQSLRIVSTKVE